MCWWFDQIWLTVSPTPYSWLCSDFLAYPNWFKVVWTPEKLREMQFFQIRPKPHLEVVWNVIQIWFLELLLRQTLWPLLCHWHLKSRETGENQAWAEYMLLLAERCGRQRWEKQSGGNNISFLPLDSVTVWKIQSDHWNRIMRTLCLLDLIWETTLICVQSEHIVLIQTLLKLFIGEHKLHLCPEEFHPQNEKENQNFNVKYQKLSPISFIIIDAGYLTAKFAYTRQ